MLVVVGAAVEREKGVVDQETAAVDQGTAAVDQGTAAVDQVAAVHQEEDHLIENKNIGNS